VTRRRALPHGPSRPHRHRRHRAAAALALAGCAALTACGSDEGPPQLTWYINPDTGDQARIAEECTQASDGAYRITTSILPTEADGQREQLVRRLAAGDTGIDLMSLDPPFAPEFAEAGFLHELPEDFARTVTEGVVESAVIAATWKDEIVAAPFWANTQLLWYRKSVAEAAGLDMSQPVTWEQIVEAAQDQDATIAVQGRRYEGYVVWINALVESAGGKILENPEQDPESLETGLDTDAGRRAAQVIRDVATKAGGPGITTADEEAARALFQSDQGGFMLNWPYVWAAMTQAAEAGQVDEGFLDDVGWALYPRVTEDEAPAPPFGGILLGVGAFTEHPDEAFDAAECIVSVDKQIDAMLSGGNPVAAVEGYDDPEVRDAFPMAEAILDSLQQARPRPQTPYYGEVSGSLQRVWHPPTTVDPESDPDEAGDLILGVIRGERLL
jgi:multiple sugar transport system substrate-binding protein